MKPNQMAETPRRRRWTDEEKRRILEELEASGLGVIEFGRRSGIASSCLFRWRRCHGAVGRRESGKARLRGVKPAREAFTAVRIVGTRHEAQGEPALDVVHVSGWSVRVPTDFDASHLSRVLRAVTSPC